MILQEENKDIIIKVTNLLHRIGVPANIKGHEYLRCAIVLAYKNETYMNSVTKEIYSRVAQKYDVTPSSVERAMRIAISIAWDRGDIILLTELFGFTINCEKGKPTNSEFIAMLCDNIKLNY